MGDAKLLELLSEYEEVEAELEKLNALFKFLVRKRSEAHKALSAYQERKAGVS